MKRVSLTEEQKAALKDLNVSDSIRFLDKEGLSRVEIASTLDKKYQHVRNVLVSDKSAAKRKTTFKLTESNITQFNQGVKDLGLKRDQYLDSLLPDALDSLEASKPNSEETLRFIRERHRPDPTSGWENENLVKVNLNLEKSLVERMNTLCAEKRIPRDLFIEGLLEIANMGLGHALETLRYPLSFCQQMGIELCYDFLMSDAQADELREQIRENELMIEAIAVLKDISFFEAQRSFTKLTRLEQDRLRKNPEILNEMDALRSIERPPVALDDLI